jgi:hypothetical protein
MNLYNQMDLITQAKQSEMLKEAERKRLANVAQSGQRRFRLFSWRLPNFRLLPVIHQPKINPEREVKRKTASNQA